MVTFSLKQNCENFSLPQLIKNSEEAEFPYSLSSSLLELASILAPRFETPKDVLYLMQEIEYLLSCHATLKKHYFTTLNLRSESNSTIQ
jgi:hypothetical protein